MFNDSIKLLKLVYKRLLFYSFILALVITFFGIGKVINVKDIRNTYFWYIANHYVVANEKEKIINTESITKFNDPDYRAERKSVDDSGRRIIGRYRTIFRAKDLIEDNSFSTSKEKIIKTLNLNSILFFIYYILSFVFISVVFLLKNYFVDKGILTRGKNNIS
jgi:hypothetical protein